MFTWDINLTILNTKYNLILSLYIYVYSNYLYLKHCKDNYVLFKQLLKPHDIMSILHMTQITECVRPIECCHVFMCPNLCVIT